ncbi:MAG TPA: SlyX family protein [Arenimonas sp.]|jgi:SlyX protein|nr:SlyX family protein [Arenimonas sp.]
MPERLPEALEARLADLETRLTFQEQALSELGEAMAEARMETARMAELLQRALEDLKQLRTLLYADPGSEPPPPHY